MAEVEVKFTADTNQATSALSELRKELKAAQSAALNGDGKAAKRVAELKDKIDDLKDATKTLQGSGVEKVTTSFNTLGEGFRNFDTDKIKTGFKGVGAAMSAIPIFLVIEGIKYLVDNFNKLSNGSGVLAKSLRFVADVIGGIKNFVTDLVGSTSDATRALDKQGEAIKTNAEKVSEALAEQTAAYDNQIKIAKASGKATVDVEKAKQQAIIETNLQIAKQIEAYVRAGGELDDEKKKQLSASLAAIRAAKTEEKVIEITDQKEKLEKYKEFLKKKQEQEAEFRQADIELSKQNEKIKADTLNGFIKQNEAELRTDLNEAEIQDTTDYNIIRTKEEEDYLAYIRSLEIKSREETQAAAYQITKDGLQAAQNIADIFFIIKKNKLKEGSKEEEKAARQQFNVNKALQLSVATVTGIQSVQAAFLNGMKNPVPLLGPATAAVYAGVAAISSAASIAKIASTQYKSSGGSVDSGGGTPSAPSLPQPNTNISPITNIGSIEGGSTLLGEQIAPPTKQQTLRAVVVETDITNSQKRIKRFNDQSTF